MKKIKLITSTFEEVHKDIIKEYHFLGHVFVCHQHIKLDSYLTISEKLTGRPFHSQWGFSANVIFNEFKSKMRKDNVKKRHIKNMIKVMKGEYAKNNVNFPVNV
jgi:hypothetical protein